MAADWSMLPSDPLGAIAMKFDVFDDFIRFSAVCRGWNGATSLVEDQWRAPLPSLLLAENTEQNPDRLRKIFDLNNNQTYQTKLPETFGTRCWGSPYGWVAMADNNYNVQLFNPITKAQIHFPSFKSLTHYTDEVDEYYSDNNKFLIYFLFKLIVVKVSQNGKDEFVIMVIYKCNEYVDFARSGDEAWTSISTKVFIRDPNPKKRIFTRMIDIVAKNDDIFALYANGAVVHWHARDFCSGKLLIPKDYSPLVEIVRRPIMGQSQKYLVECCGDLLLVVRYKEEFHDSEQSVEHYETKAIDVFKLTRHNGLEKIDDIRNVALFVGGNYSMSISLGVGQRSQHNGIYFTDDEYGYWIYPREFGGHDTGFYDLKLNTSHFFKLDAMRSSFCPATSFIPIF